MSCDTWVVTLCYRTKENFHFERKIPPPIFHASQNSTKLNVDIHISVLALIYISSFLKIKFTFRLLRPDLSLLFMILHLKRKSYGQSSMYRGDKEEKVWICHGYIDKTLYILLPTFSITGKSKQVQWHLTSQGKFSPYSKYPLPSQFRNTFLKIYGLKLNGVPCLCKQT